ncbi:hypothetical protein [Streptomyces sp. B1I3]|uniref:hypothetical protein n=1 Tax=Streptomyces sp. B1I3 TaxID=3042264 RepID=UPI0027D7F7D9|nr:hypothetical protein [Streptomyces sp. B1I3]
MHAEIERFLEELLSCAVASSKYIHSQLGHVTEAGAAAMVHHQSRGFLEGRKDSTPYYLSRGRILADMPKRLEDAIQSIELSVVAGNNGIKKHDIRRLMGWIGIDTSEIDATLVAALEAFGSERGDAAHLSRREIWRRFNGKYVHAQIAKVRRLPAPSDEVVAVHAVLQLLPALDRLVQVRARKAI